jgi:predicted amidophosphoribosyltransferase
MPTIKKIAIWRDCAGVVSDGKYLHSMRDGCSSCAPWWARVPVCPDCGRKAQKTGRQKCKKCATWFVVEKDPGEEKATFTGVTATLASDKEVVILYRI